jgi:hypothetical protein
VRFFPQFICGLYKSYCRGGFLAPVRLWAIWTGKFNFDKLTFRWIDLTSLRDILINFFANIFNHQDYTLVFFYSTDFQSKQIRLLSNQSLLHSQLNIGFFHCFSLKKKLKLWYFLSKIQKSGFIQNGWIKTNLKF